MKVINDLIIALILLFLAHISFADDYIIGQKNKTFSANTLKIKVGDVVHFENNDPFFHNVYSLSDVTTFDLGSYPKGESKSVTFDTPGVVPVECAIHPHMYMEVIVEAKVTTKS